MEPQPHFYIAGIRYLSGREIYVDGRGSWLSDRREACQFTTNEAATEAVKDLAKVLGIRNYYAITLFAHEHTLKPNPILTRS